MAEYDDAISPPDWWYEQLETALVALTKGAGDQRVTLGQIAEMANAIDGRKRWDGPNITKLRNRQHATVQLVLAISQALGLTPPLFLPISEVEAVAMQRWVLAHRYAPTTVRSGNRAREHEALQRLDATVKTAIDQTDTVPLVSEGSPRSPRTRRAPRGRS